MIENGVARFIYTDALAALASDGVTTRASHVEPAAALLGDPTLTGWLSDMRPSGGPILTGPNGAGFPTREAALAAERDWLATERNL